MGRRWAKDTGQIKYQGACEKLPIIILSCVRTPPFVLHDGQLLSRLAPTILTGVALSNYSAATESFENVLVSIFHGP